MVSLISFVSACIKTSVLASICNELLFAVTCFVPDACECPFEILSLLPTSLLFSIKNCPYVLRTYGYLIVFLASEGNSFFPVFFIDFKLT